MTTRRLKLLTLILCCAALSATCLAADSAPPTLEQQLRSEPAAELAQAALREGDAVRGAMIFHHSAITCIACHSVGDRPNAIGPDLTKLDRKTTDAAIVESLLEPSKVIAPAYAMIAVETSGGLVIRGVPVEETPAQLVLRDAAQPEKLVVLKPADIVSRHQDKESIMPAGQVNLLSARRDFLDLTCYLLALRDGGADRAHEIERALESLVREFPDKPLPHRPVVQRGEIAVAGGEKYPRGVALGFAEGTVLFDADQLKLVAAWRGGFVKPSPQNYFGVYWQSAGHTPQSFKSAAHPLTFKMPGDDRWQAFEPPLESDPNEGTRFDGYQIGRDWVRLHYRVRVNEQRMGVTEDIRATAHDHWQGITRAFRFTHLPAGAQVALQMPDAAHAWQAGNDGVRIASTGQVAPQAPWLGFQLGDQPWAVHAPANATWSADRDQRQWRLISSPAENNQTVELRLDTWQYLGSNTTIAPAELKELLTGSAPIADPFELEIQPPAPLPPLPELTALDESRAKASPQRPSVKPQENIDEFPPTTGRFLRFTVTGTIDQAEPGIDELEIYGDDPDVNLALQGQPSASSVIAGYAIHQIKHLNDGKLGNHHSWISAEPGGGWAQIEFTDPVKMRKIVWARDRTGASRDRLAAKYRIEVSNDGKAWVKVGDESGRIPPTSAGTIQRNASPGYEMESIPLPFPGCRPSDIVFAEDGTMYLLAMTEGQVWRTRTPPVGHPQQVNWQRYASGLYHPIGLAMVGARLFVSQKPEITELIDHDGDGTVDHYRTLATGWGLSTGWHEYCFGLAVDRQENLWFALNTGYFWTNPGYVNPGRWRGSVMRVNLKSGRLAEVAKGCRVPNGICVDGAGDLFFTDNQGDWIQACKLAHVVEGRFYGHPEYKADALPADQAPNGPSAIWFPYHRMRSISGPIVDTTLGKFGPFAGQTFVGDVGYGANAGIMRVALEKVDGEYQGACFPFVDNQPLGCERMRFGPDHQLYIASLTSGLTRLAYVAKTAPLAMKAVHIRPGGNGFVVHLTKPLAADQNINPAQFSVARYHYLYTGNYGSPQADEQAVAVEAAELSPDRTQITLTFPVETSPIGMVYAIRVGELRDEQGEKLQHNEAWYTVHRIPK